MKRFILLAVTSIALLSSQPQSQGKMQVQLGCRAPGFAYVDENPFVTLSVAIKQDQKSSRFRVSWVEMLGSGWNKGTMLYDRKQKILKYYDVGGAGEERKERSEYYRKHYLFEKMTDDTFFNLVKIYNNEKQINKLLPFSFIELLPKQGHRRHKFVDFRKGF